MTKQNSIFNVESYLEMILKDAFFYFMRFSFNKKNRQITITAMFLNVQWWIQGGALGTRLTLFLDQTETRRAEKKKYSRPPPSSSLSEGLDAPLKSVCVTLFLIPAGLIKEKT